MKYNWNSTNKNKKIKLLGFILLDISPLKSQKREKLLFLGYFGGLGTNVEFNGFFVILWISGSFSLYLLVKNSFKLKLGFFTYFKYISGYHQKTFYVQITTVPGDIDATKTRKTFHKLHIDFFSQCLIVNSSLLRAFMVQNFCKNSFSGGKSRKNGISVIKITCSLQKIPQNYRFPWVNTKTIKYTYRFNKKRKPWYVLKSSVFKSF